MHNSARVAFVWLALLHASVIAAGFLTPYDPEAQNRTMPFAPPTRVHVSDAHGNFPVQPFVCRYIMQPGRTFDYEEDCSEQYSVRFFAAIDSRLRLFSVEEPGVIYLFGTDEYGRDQFGRFLFGGRISLFTGVLGCAISLGIAFLLGSLSGFYGNWLDEAIMWMAELFLALPWLYLLFAVRAFMPLATAPTTAFMLIVALVGVVGWARPARLVRGAVLSAREREYVAAARAFGGSGFYVMRRHLLPQVQGVLRAQASLLIPRYIVAEVTLSFLGLGINEPAASWGNMLTVLQRYHVITSYWWMFLPGIALVPTFMAYQALTIASRNNNCE